MTYALNPGPVGQAPLVSLEKFFGRTRDLLWRPSACLNMQHSRNGMPTW